DAAAGDAPRRGRRARPRPGRGRAGRGEPPGTIRSAPRARLRAAGAALVSSPGPGSAGPGGAVPGGAGPDGTPPALLYSGKVRDVYGWGDDRPLLVASDRVSAYDHVLATPIPDKGKILTQLSLWWFGQLADLIPNHLVDAEIPAEFAGRAMACRRLSMVPVECVARGYLAGSGLREYRGSRSVWGVPLPPGLVEGSRLPEPIFTPATKAPRGQHDENIPLSAVAATVGADVAADLERITLEGYRRWGGGAAPRR